MLILCHVKDHLAGIKTVLVSETLEKTVFPLSRLWIIRTVPLEMAYAVIGAGIAKTMKKEPKFNNE